MAVLPRPRGYLTEVVGPREAHLSWYADTFAKMAQAASNLLVSWHILLIMHGQPSVHCLTYSSLVFNSVTYLKVPYLPCNINTYMSMFKWCAQ
jgi:hypothetical protein